ncbi:MAG: hypothetical protein RBR53_05955 [Desulforegulaceae bacterium]|nr:hypothetical protein [Desulforegulaceae bacterium]
MRVYGKYSDEFKKAIIKKCLSNPDKSVNFIAREIWGDPEEEK